MKYADLILPLAVPQLYTYSIPQELQANCEVGMRAVVQFGKRKFYSGIIRNIHSSKPKLYETKPISSILDEKLIITDLHFKFWDWIADYYMCSIGEVMKAALPSGLKLESQTKIYLNIENSNIKELSEKLELDSISMMSDNFLLRSYNYSVSEKEEIIILALKEKNILTINEINSLLGLKSSLTTITKLLEKEIIRTEEKGEINFKPKLEKQIKLSASIKTEKDLENAFAKISGARKQSEVLMIFISFSKLKFNKFTNKFDYKEVKKTSLLKMINTSPTAIKGLINKDIFQEIEIEIDRIDDNNFEIQKEKTLSEAQQTALTEIENHFIEKDNVLLHGITSSGKTELYIKLIKEYISQGKQVLYLLPEIALTTQIINRLKVIFGNQVGVYHSKFSDAERVEIWNKTQLDEFGNPIYKIILGVRSSIFLPFNNLGLIIIDEEHETTYKQFDPAPRYNARDAAIVLAKLHGAKVLLGTATPSIETYFNVVTKKFALVELNERHKNISLPEIIIADVKQAGKKKEMKSLFHPILLDNIEQALKNDEQIILFQNRRGFSPYMECKTCGWIPKCEHCDVSLTYHKFTNELTCHYCGYSYQSPTTCLACGDTGMETKGFGTQKIEEEIKIFFPEIKVARMDLDTTRGKKGYEKIITRFENRKIDILIGTQMVSKGLDFDNVSIVGIMNADSMLNYPNFRAYERSYQLMAQVSGRAGRSKKQGKVIIQTSQPDNKIIKYVVVNAYRRMFKDQLDERIEFKYPPYYRLIKITIKHKNIQKVDNFADLFAKKLRITFDQRVLGPEYPIINRIQNWYMKDILLKLEKKISINKSKEIILNATAELKSQKNFSNVQVIYNADPI